MLQRPLSERLLSLTTFKTTTKHQSPTISSCVFIISFLVPVLFMMPSAHAAGCKIPKSYYKNVSCTASSGYFLAVKDFGAPVALIDKQGKSLVDLSSYQKVDADKISAGLLPVMRNGHVGYVNMQGREVIPVMYNALNDGQGWARPVSEGCIVVKQGGYYGVIDTANKVIVPFSSAISDIDNYKGGMARVRKNKAISWVDKNGNTKDTQAQDTQAQNSTTKNSNAQNANVKSTTDSRVNKKQENSASRPVNRFTTLQPRQQDGRWGFVDDNNVNMITYSFDEVRPFSEGLAGVRINGEWGFINLGGELVIPFGFNDLNVLDSTNDRSVTFENSYKDKPSFVFVDNKAWIGSLENGNKMCIDKEGTAVACD